MKKLLFIFAFAASALYVNSQKVTGCGFKVPPRSLLKTNFQSVYEAKQIINNMKDSIHWTENFSVKSKMVSAMLMQQLLIRYAGLFMTTTSWRILTHTLLPNGHQ